MSAHFTFAIDRPRGLIRISMSGLFQAQDVADFLFARRRAHAELGAIAGGHLTLNDVRAMKIQPQQTVAAFHDLLANPEFPSRRLAFVVSPTLARSQLARALDARTARCFPSMEEAEAWLFDEASEAVAPPLRRVA
jgi:hypothetical protein